MTREGTRLISAIVTAVLAAAMFSACGSSDSSSGDSAATSDSAAQQADRSGGEDTSSTGGESGDSRGTAGSGGNGGGSDNEDSEPVSVPLQVSGGGSDQFRSKGGDNSIQEFGEESDESELQEAAEAVHDFYVARAEGDWAGACSRLSKSMLERLEQLATSSTELEDKSCASFLAAFTGKLEAAEWRAITTMDAGSLRQEGEQAFLIYFGADRTVYAMPLTLEEDEWKVAALAATTLG